MEYSVGRNSGFQLIKRAFIKAYDDRCPKALIIHTDNAAAETFFNALKRESLIRDDYPRSFRELKERVGTYMEWYNSGRLHRVVHMVTSPRVTSFLSARYQ